MYFCDALKSIPPVRVAAVRGLAALAAPVMSGVAVGRVAGDLARVDDEDGPAAAALEPDAGDELLAVVPDLLGVGPDDPFACDKD